MGPATPEVRAQFLCNAPPPQRGFLWEKTAPGDEWAQAGVCHCPGSPGLSSGVPSSPRSTLIQAAPSRACCVCPNPAIEVEPLSPRAWAD